MPGRSNARDEDVVRRLGTNAQYRVGFRLAVSSENGTPIRRENLWPRYILPKLEPADLAWATFQVMRRSFATWAKKAGVDAHTRSAQMGNTVDVNENEYAVATFDQKLAAIRRLEKVIKE